MSSEESNYQSTEWSLNDYHDFFFRRWKMFTATFVVVLVSALLYILLQPDLFYSASTFIVDLSESSLDGIGGRNTMSYFDPEAKKRQIEIYRAVIQSRDFQESLRAAMVQDTLLSQKKIAREEIEQTLGQLNLFDSDKTELLSLSATASDPVLSYRLAINAFDIFVDRTREIKLAETHNIVNYVEDQKQIVGGKLEETERSLQQFGKIANSKATNVESGLISKLINLEMLLTDVQTERELAEANIQSYNKRLRDMDINDTPLFEDMDDPGIKSLQHDIDSLSVEKNRLMIKADNNSKIAVIENVINNKKDEIYKKIINSKFGQGGKSDMKRSMGDQIRENRVKEELSLYILRNREKYYRQLVKDYRQQNPRIIDRAIEEAQLKRSKNVYENLYNILLEKGEEARILASASTGGIRLIDKAFLQETPIAKHNMRKLVLGIILGLGLGLGLALLQEVLDHSIRNAETLKQHTGLAIMGTVPEIRVPSMIKRGKKDSRSARARTSGKDITERRKSEQNKYHGQLISSLKPRDSIIDTYRTLRTNLQFANIDSTIHSILISSALPAEGKTLTVANLAISFADMGKRICLLDCDLRKPKQHQIFAIKRDPGLTNYLVGSTQLTEIIKPTQSKNLMVIPSGTLPPNPSEMVASQRMTDLLRELEEMFDLILIDSPPLNLVPDPAILAAKVGQVLLVIKFASTNLRIVESALQVLRLSKSHVIGAILNYVIIKRGYGYYTNYYSYYYSDYREKKIINKSQGKTDIGT